MQQTIAGKVYDTETAKAMGNWQRGLSSDRAYISETLYLTTAGLYFLHGEGGSRSRYAQRTAPNTWGYGERIMPMDEEEAHAWAENHLTDNIYDKAFGANAHEETLTPLLIRLRPAVIERLTQAAREQNCSPVSLAESLIAKGLDVE